MTPLVRAVVVSHVGGAALERCLAQLADADWPADRLELVVVDNGSAGAAVSRVASAHPRARVVRSDRNLGFAGGNNLALADLDGDYAALLNDDAFVERQWLRPLVESLERDRGLGAATSKVLFAPRYLEHEVDGPVTLTGVRVDVEDRWRDTLLPRGWLESDHAAEAGPPCRRAEGRAAIWIPQSTERRAELRLDGEWTAVELAGEPFDVINNVGCVLLPRGHAADRGFLERDEGQYDEPAEVFAWSGTSVLLRRAYLEDVGLFDEGLFAYYEDVDLSWRGRGRGWRYLYIPGSVARHAHASTTRVGSSLFDYHVERNRLLVHAKNAPPGQALAAVGESLRVTGLHVRRDVLERVRNGERPTAKFLRRRARAFGGFLRHLPRTLRERRSLPEHVPSPELERWLSRR